MNENVDVTSIFNSSKSKSKLSTVKNPFSKKGIDSVYIHIHPNVKYTKVACASVNFSNGKTSGSQDFEDDTWEGLMIQLSTFMDELD
jgi:hypothetical protein